MKNTPNAYQQKTRRNWFFWIFLLLIVLLIGLCLLGYGPWGRHCQANAPVAVATSNNTGSIQPPIASAPSAAAGAHSSSAAPAAPAVVSSAPSESLPTTSTSVNTSTSPAPAAAVATVKVSAPPELNIYFNINKTETPTTVQDSLKPMVAYLNNHPQTTVQLTGLHDPSGSMPRNLQLANERSKAVQTQLQEMGVASNRIEILSPSQTTGTGQPKQARRVELRVVAAK